MNLDHFIRKAIKKTYEYLIPPCFTIFDILGDPGAVSWVRKNGANVFNNGRETAWDLTLNELVPRLMPIIVSDWFGSQRLSRCGFRDLLIRRSLSSNSSVRRACPGSVVFFEGSF